MTAGWCARALRAAVFAAVCVLLASLGHTMMSGAAVPWWAMAAGTPVVGAAAWLSAGRERGPVAVGSAVVAAQAVLHALFSLAQALVQTQPSGGAPLVRRWADLLLCASHAGPGAEHATTSASMESMGSMASMHHVMGAGAVHPMGTTGRAGTADALSHGTGGLSSTGMLAAHLLAALLCGLWLAHGERAAFRVLRTLRTLAGWAAVPLRLVLRLPAPPHRPRPRTRRDHAGRVPRHRLLTHSLISRGPPRGTAVA